MYRTIRTIHRYNTIHTICTYISNDFMSTYDTPLRYKTFVHDTYRISYDTENYALVYLEEILSCNDVL